MKIDLTISSVFFVGVGIFVALLRFFVPSLRRLLAPWPFKELKQRGTYKSSVLPTSGSAFAERKRDFARIAATKGGLLVLTSASGVAQPYASSGASSGDFSEEKADAVFAEFEKWLAAQLAEAASGTKVTADLAARVVGSVAVNDTVAFAMAHKVPPMFPQSKFLLVLSSSGEARVLWLAFATPEPKPNMTSTPYLVKLLSSDLNSEQAAEQATAKGLPLEYAVVHTSCTSLDDYILKQRAAAFSRAAVENNWDDVLGSV
eukprot:TRINITY_DN123372_c0_g1_i1.p1 TRINITY_DN123372_c0_g1~~TRINITY_DN123372_c0_g1_i1.p1  ORF type:complete len:260 (+),score=79.17 TRINITY_DN123372_c0_g1_i1:95-874(+)